MCVHFDMTDPFSYLWVIPMDMYTVKYNWLNQLSARYHNMLIVIWLTQSVDAQIIPYPPTFIFSFNSLYTAPTTSLGAKESKKN